jgi:hypothetical protein
MLVTSWCFFVVLLAACSGSYSQSKLPVNVVVVCTTSLILYYVFVLDIHSVNYGQVVSVNLTFDASDLGPISPNGFFDLEPTCLQCPDGQFLEDSTVCAQVCRICFESALLLTLNIV